MDEFNEIVEDVELIDLGENRVVAVSSTPRDGWFSLAAPVMASLIKTGTATNNGCAQLFQMHPVDHQKWSVAKKYGSDGFTSATWWEDRRIAGNARIRPASPSSSPSAGTVPQVHLVAVAVVASQILARFDALEAKLDALMAKVDEIARFLKNQNFSQVTAAIREVRNVHASYVATGQVGSVDWSRIQDHGRIISALHEMVVMELEAVRAQLACTDMAGAKAAISAVHSAEVRQLVDTESVLVELYEHWNALYLLRKLEAGETTQGDDMASKQRVAVLKSRASVVFDSFEDLDTIHIHGRGIVHMLSADGLILGRRKDKKKRAKAQRLRKICIQIVQAHPRYEVEELPVLRLVAA
jgi:hypothetical protein